MMSGMTGAERAEVMVRMTFGPNHGIEFSPDGALLAVCSAHHVEIIDARGGRVLRLIRGHAGMETFRLIGSHGFAFDEQYVQDIAGRSWDRGYDPDGFRRQLAASASQPNRTADLRRITVPALVIHGLHDPLVAASGGLAVARAIPGSRFVGFSGMGHDLPRALWPEFVREIAALTAVGERRRRQGPPAG